MRLASCLFLLISTWTAWRFPNTGSTEKAGVRNVEQELPASKRAPEPVEQTLVDSCPETAPILAEENPAAPMEPAEVWVDPALALQAGPLPWESRVHQIINAGNVDDSVKARQLFAVLISLPDEGLEYATTQALLRLRDKDYGVASSALLNPQTHGRILGVLFSDLLERRDMVALPMLLAVAKTKGHPFAESAQDNLTLLLGKNYGENWAEWDAAVRRSLTESGPRK